MAGGTDVAATTTALSCSKCSKPANLQCPKCVELKLPREGAAFCTQDCFKASWSSHKSVHLKAKLSTTGAGTLDNTKSNLPDGWRYCLRKGQSRSPQPPHFDWTGKYRIASKFPRGLVTTECVTHNKDAIRHHSNPGRTTYEIL